MGSLRRSAGAWMPPTLSASAGLSSGVKSDLTKRWAASPFCRGSPRVRMPMSKPLLARSTIVLVLSSLMAIWGWSTWNRPRFCASHRLAKGGTVGIGKGGAQQVEALPYLRHQAIADIAEGDLARAPDEERRADPLLQEPDLV